MLQADQSRLIVGGGPDRGQEPVPGGRHRVGPKNLALQPEATGEVTRDLLDSCRSQLVAGSVLPLPRPGGGLAKALGKVHRCLRSVAEADQGELGELGRVATRASGPAVPTSRHAALDDSA